MHEQDFQNLNQNNSKLKPEIHRKDNNVNDQVGSSSEFQGWFNMRKLIYIKIN